MTLRVIRHGSLAATSWSYYPVQTIKMRQHAPLVDYQLDLRVYQMRVNIYNSDPYYTGVTGKNLPMQLEIPRKGKPQLYANPYEHFAFALGGCMTAYLARTLEAKKLDISEMRCYISFNKNEREGVLENFKFNVNLPNVEMSNKTSKMIRAIVSQCPVKQTIEAFDSVEVVINDQ